MKLNFEENPTPLEHMIERDDEEHLDFATNSGRVLYSFNISDFCRIHARWINEERSHAGIIVALQQQYSVGEQMRRLLRLSSKLAADQMLNRLEILGNWI